MAFFDNIATTLPTFAGGLLSLASSNSGINMALQGANLKATSFRNAGAAAMSVANYNVGVERLNLNRQLEQLNRDVFSFTSTQRVQAVSTGFDPTSKSFLLAVNDSLDTFSNTILDLKNSSDIRQKQILFEGQLAQVEFENQARIAQFQGQVSAFGQQRKQAQGFGNLFSGLFGG